MNEIDFEELDRAVNSLNTQSQPTPDSTPVPTPQAVSADTAIPVASPAVTVPVAATPAPVAPRPATGRFMDMVHPSADMRTAVVPRPTPMATPITQSNESPQSNSIPAPEVPSSPFLPDAQVEKRPLGAFATYTPSSSIDQQPTATAPETPSEDLSYQGTSSLGQDLGQDLLTDQAEVEQATLPPELHTDVLDIESNEEVAPAIETSPQTSVEQPTVSTVVTPQEPVSSDPVATFGGSIPQQYTEKPVEQPADSQITPVFDAHAFTQPPKKKNGWLVVLWIFLLILLGAGAGAAIYFYVLPLL